MSSLKKFDSNTKKANEEYGLGLVRSTSFGRKRVALSDVCLEFGDYNEDDCCFPNTRSKRMCLKDSIFGSERPSSLEDMPFEILIRIVCGTDHDDLKSLFFVNKAFREATIIAKESHFAYSTPRKTLAFHAIQNVDDPYEIEAPNAPKQSKKVHFRLSNKKLADISVVLFASGGEKGWPRKDMF